MSRWGGHLVQGCAPAFAERGGRLLRERAVAAEKLLGGAERRLMHFLGRVNQAETRPEFCVQRVRVIAHYVEAASLYRTFGAERADNDMAARLYRPCGIVDIVHPISGVVRK